MSIMDYNKYIKYKTKYLTLKSYILQSGGQVPRKIDINTGYVSHQTLSDCVKELIDTAYEIYTDLLSKNKQITLICGGQSPAYYCLAMINFKIYDPNKVEIVIIPHSKGGEKATDPNSENIKYCKRLREKGVKVRLNATILDGVHTGVGIMALESAIKHCYPETRVERIAINCGSGVSQIHVNKEYHVPCEPKFSDVFRRLIPSYYPRDFDDPNKFITEFEIEGNDLAEMIIQCAKVYPEIKVEDTEWFKLNNEVTDEIKANRIKYDEIKANRIKYDEEREIREREENKTFIPIVLSNPKRYKCPICKNTSGTTLEVTHSYNCLYKNYKPNEENAISSGSLTNSANKTYI